MFTCFLITKNDYNCIYSIAYYKKELTNKVMHNKISFKEKVGYGAGYVLFGKKNKILVAQ